MKNKDQSTKDMPTLGDGWAHFVPEAPYMAHVQKCGHEENVRSTLFQYCLFYHWFLFSAIYAIPTFML